MGFGRIPFTAIYEYAKIYDVEDFETFNYIIKTMDNKLAELQNKKSDSKGNNGKG